MKQLKKFNEFLNESKVEVLDDLKANFRSWEQDHDNKEDAEGLYNILKERHPEEDDTYLKSQAYHWVGYEEEQVETLMDFNKAFEMFIKGQKVVNTYFKEPFGNPNLPHEERYYGQGMVFENNYIYLSYGGGASGEDYNVNFIINPKLVLIAKQEW